MSDSLAQALPLFAQKLKGFDNPQALLTAPETRSSSPVRICRTTKFEAYCASDEREKQLAEKLKGEEKEIKEEEAKNSAEEKAAERKVTIEGSKVTVEKNTSTEPTTDKEK